MLCFRRQVAELVGAEHDEIVFVPNTTHGLNTFVRNIEWREGDIILASKLSHQGRILYLNSIV
jgi:hercynylcysteine S-oxide lyase